jgi:hypothetical protein
MKTLIYGALVLGLLALGAGRAAEKADQHDKSSAKPAKEPFYRSYLIPGDPLDDKIREQEKLIEANPDSAALHNDLGNLLARRRFPKEAREQYEIAMKLDKKAYLPYYNIGIVYEMEGHASKAIHAYERCVDLNRGFPPGLFRLGRLYERQGHEQAAIDAYAKALAIDPLMRDPAHNPLVVDTNVLDRAMLAVYQQMLARMSLDADARYADEARFRRLPYDRSIDSGELEARPAAAAGAPAATPAPPRSPAAIPAAPGQTRPQELAPAPASAIPPPTPPPAPIPPQAAPSRVPPGVPVYAPPTPNVQVTPIPPPSPEESPGPPPEESPGPSRSLEVGALD